MIEVKGYKEILNVVIGLPREFSDPYLRRVHRKAVIPLENEIHRRAPVGLTGNLADSIGTVKADGLGGIATGPRRKGGFKGYHAHNVEYGHKSRSKGRGKSFVPAHPFERPAWEAKNSQVESIIAKELERDLGQFIRRKL